MSFITPDKKATTPTAIDSGYDSNTYTGYHSSYVGPEFDQYENAIDSECSVYDPSEDGNESDFEEPTTPKAKTNSKATKNEPASPKIKQEPQSTATTPVSTEGFTFPLSDQTPLGQLEPASTAFCINPTRKYVQYLEESMNYVFLAFRFGAACTALMRFGETDAANAIGQFAVNLIGSGMFLTGVKHYLEGTGKGDDIVSVKYCMVDVIEDIEAYLDTATKTNLGCELRKIVNECGLTFDPDEMPAVVVD